MELFKQTPHIKFLKYKYVALAITALIVVSGILNVTVFKGLKLGVDFGEGSLIRVMFKSPVGVGQVRDELQRVGLGGSTIQETGEGGREFQIRTAQVQQIGGGAANEQLEAHSELADRVVAALADIGGAAKSDLPDLNTIEESSLANLLRDAYAQRGPEIAKTIVAERMRLGIITDYAQLSKAGVDASVTDYLKTKTSIGPMTVLSRETVGPQVGKDLRKKAVQATIWSLIGMLIYIAVRFKFEYGLAAIFTLTQDVLITMSVYSFTNREINLPIIAAILTIVGYSINDTIVIFDRVRENSRLMRRESLENIMNLTLNQTLSRTLITSGTVFLTVLALFLFGGPVINDFAFLMLVGTIEGVYSTIYLACPVVLFYQKLFKTKSGFHK